MCRLRDFYLDEMDAWQSGARATPGCPANGERYPLRMREAVKGLEKALTEHVAACSRGECVADRAYWTRKAG